MTDDPQAETTLVEGPQTVSHNANELRRKLATAERIRENADFHLGQEMARRQLAEKETARLRAELAALSTPASTAPLAAGFPLVQGNCPACQRASLFLGSGGYVTCSSADCPEPDAATTVLEGGANWPAVRAALYREVADELAGINFHPNAKSQNLELCRLLAGRFRRKADEVEREGAEAQPAASDRCPHGCDVSTCPCLACEADQPDGETQQPETGPFVPPAHYRGRDGTAYCVHAIPIGPDSCPHCRELADEQPAAVSQPGEEG